MTWRKRIANSLFAIIFGASLAFLPALAFAAEEPPASKGIVDQFNSFDGEEGQSSGSASTEATGQSEGYAAGENATGDWMQQEAPSTYVFDDYGVFSTEQYNHLEGMAEGLAEKYSMGVYFLATDLMNGNPNPTAEERTRFASAYYVNHSLGLGSGKDGILFVIAVDSRDYVTVAYGQGSYSFSDKGISSMEDDVTGYLHDNKWFDAAQAYYNDIGTQLNYYAEKGKPGTPLGPLDYVLRIGAIVLIPLIIALIAVSGMKGKMKTAKEKTEARDYLDQSSLVLTVSEDTFINSSVVATPRADSKGGGGGGGGGWGGGGGGGFSSSGGGKF